MPELPEVESFRRFFDKHAKGKCVKSCSLDDDFRLEGITRKELYKSLKGSCFTKTFRHGKFLFCEMNTGRYLVFHFGMTGYFETGDIKHPALLFHFPDESDFAFVDRRKIGRISLTTDPLEYLKNRNWGEDALKISEKNFVSLLSSRKAPVKSVLMNQHLVAGIGNEFSDEILFQEKLHPARPANKISPDKWKDIFRTSKEILKTAVKANAERKKLRQYYFLDNRKAGKPCPACGTEISFKSVGGRSSYFCGNCQR